VSILLLAIILVLLAFIYEENRGDSRWGGGTDDSARWLTATLLWRYASPWAHRRERRSSVCRTGGLSYCPIGSRSTCGARPGAQGWVTKPPGFWWPRQ